MKKYSVNVHHILWDVDVKSDLKLLPKKMTVEVEAEGYDDMVNKVSDAISDEAGFCHAGFDCDVTDCDYLITEEHKRRAMQVLIDNGVEEDEAEVVLRAIGHTLLDEELFPDGEGDFGEECEETAEGDLVHVILRDGDAEDAIEALEAAGIDAEYLDDTRILVESGSEYGDVLDAAGIHWDVV